MKDTPYLLESIGITIERLRLKQNLTKTALASFSDIQDCYLRGIIKGNRNPTIVTIYSICEALGVSPLEFFRRVEEEIEHRQKTRQEIVNPSKTGVSTMPTKELYRGKPSMQSLQNETNLVNRLSVPPVTKKS